MQQFTFTFEVEDTQVTKFLLEMGQRGAKLFDQPYVPKRARRKSNSMGSKKDVARTPR
jgi:hypothetical protein